MKIFESLNCCLCKSPFAPIANQPRSPRQLACGKAACHECFQAEKALKKEERDHQCNRDDCFYNPNFLNSLIEILSSSSLVHFPLRTGFLLAENFKRPECPICHEEFSTGGQNIPYLLYCLHNLCKGCYKKCRKPYEGVKKGQFFFQVTCAKCSVNTLTSSGSYLDNQVIGFLKELPEMTLQLEEMKNTEYRFCDDCKSMDSIERMFDCLQCKKKICGTCAFQKHRIGKHKVFTLLEKEALDLSKNMQEKSISEVATYQKLFPELHLNLGNNIKDFLEKLTHKEEMVRKKPAFEALQKSYNKCKWVIQFISRLQSDFESFSEEYIPNLRKYNTKLEGLVKELEEDPD